MSTIEIPLWLFSCMVVFTALGVITAGFFLVLVMGRLGQDLGGD